MKRWLVNTHILHRYAWHYLNFKCVIRYMPMITIEILKKIYTKRWCVNLPTFAFMLSFFIELFIILNTNSTTRWCLDQLGHRPFGKWKCGISSVLLPSRQIKNGFRIQYGCSIQDCLQNENNFLKMYHSTDLAELFLKYSFICAWFLETFNFMKKSQGDAKKVKCY